MSNKYSYRFELSKNESSYGRPQLTIFKDENGIAVEDFADPTTAVGVEFCKLVLLNIMLNLEIKKEETFSQEEIERFLTTVAALDKLKMSTFTKQEMLAFKSSAFMPHVALTISFDGSNPPPDWRGFLSQADFLKIDFTGSKTLDALDKDDFKIMTFLKNLHGYGPGISVKVAHEVFDGEIRKSNFLQIVLRNGVLLIDGPITKEQYIKIKELNDDGHQVGVIQCSLN